LTNKKNKLDAGELSPRTWQTHYQTCKTLLAHFGPDRRVDDLRPDDFVAFRAALAKRYGVVGLHNAVNCVRGVFKFALEQEKIEKPVRYGQSLDRPSKRALRKAREDAGERLFTSDEMDRLLDAADPQIRAMVMLGLNAGFGNSDVANLPRRSLDLASAWLRFPRPKTGIQRRVPLWPETVDALRQASALRPQATDPANDRLVFLTRTGKPWVRVQPRRRGDEFGAIVALDALSQAFRKLLKSLDINGRRGLGFYTLRHVFETIAGDAKDQVAVDAIMGHADPSMGAQYRERISDERLRAVTEHVRAWLFSGSAVAMSSTAAPAISNR
jgi:integrase